MNSFFIYKKPYEDCCHYYSQQESPRVLTSLDDLNGCHGYVIAPFTEDKDHPILLLNGASGRRIDIPLSEVSSLNNYLQDIEEESYDIQTHYDRATYQHDFESFHKELEDKVFQKLVLARSCVVRKPKTLSAQTIFQRACEKYPRQYIALFHTKRTGLWLIASPEILLEGNPINGFQTMALAGTMKYEGKDIQWSAKNKKEQKMVTDYIFSRLKPFADEIKQSKAETTLAAHLAHLRTDFHFRFKYPQQLGSFLLAFHPTPAVCGMPKEEARNFILKHEHLTRSYYSGFSGILDQEGDTHLFVTLRCMEIFSNECRLYAGGGLLKESVEENEWLETETKLDTMRRLLT